MPPTELPRVLLIYQAVDEQILEAIAAKVRALRPNVDVKWFGEFYRSTQGGHAQATFRDFVNSGERIDLAVALLPVDSKTSHNRGSGWLEVGYWLGLRGDRDLLVFHAPGLPPPFPIGGAQPFLVSDTSSSGESLGSTTIASPATTSTNRVNVGQVVTEIVKRLDSSDHTTTAGTFRSLRVLIIDDRNAPTFTETGILNGESNHSLARMLCDKLRGQQVTQGTAAFLVKPDVLSDRLFETPGSSTVENPQEFSSFSAGSLLRMKAIVSRYDLAVHLVGPDARVASEGALANVCSGFWMGRTRRFQRPGESAVQDWIYVKSWDTFEGASNLDGEHTICLKKHDSMNLADAIERTSQEILREISRCVAHWRRSQSPSKATRHVEYLMDRPPFQGMRYRDITETGYSQSKVPVDLIAPSVALILLTEEERKLGDEIRATSRYLQDFLDLHRELKHAASTNGHGNSFKEAAFNILPAIAHVGEMGDKWKVTAIPTTLFLQYQVKQLRDSAKGVSTYITEVNDFIWPYVNNHETDWSVDVLQKQFRMRLDKVLKSAPFKRFRALAADLEAAFVHYTQNLGYTGFEGKDVLHAILDRADTLLSNATGNSA